MHATYHGLDGTSFSEPVVEGRSAPAISITLSVVVTTFPLALSSCRSVRMRAQCDRLEPACPPPAWFMSVARLVRWARHVAIKSMASSARSMGTEARPMGLWSSPMKHGLLPSSWGAGSHAHV